MAGKAARAHGQRPPEPVVESTAVEQVRPAKVQQEREAERVEEATLARHPGHATLTATASKSAEDADYSRSTASPSSSPSAPSSDAFPLHPATTPSSEEFATPPQLSPTPSRVISSRDSLAASRTAASGKVVVGTALNDTEDGAGVESATSSDVADGPASGMFVEGNGDVNQDFGGGFDDEMDVDRSAEAVVEPAAAVDEPGGTGWGDNGEMTDERVQVDEEEELSPSTSSVGISAAPQTSVTTPTSASSTSPSAFASRLPPPHALADGSDASATTAALVDESDEEDKTPRFTAAQKGKGRAVSIVDEEPDADSLDAVRGGDIEEDEVRLGDLEEEFGSEEVEMDAPEVSAAGDEEGDTAQGRALDFDPDFGEYADYDPLDAHELSSPAQAKPPSPPVASSSTATSTGFIFANLSDPQLATWRRATLEISKSCPFLAYLGAFFAPDQRKRRLAGLRKVGLELLQRRAPKEDVMGAYVAEFSNLSQYPVREAELAILERMQRAQEARYERKKAHSVAGSAQRRKGKGKAIATSFNDDSTSIPEIPSLASPLVASVDLASLWRFARFFEPHEMFYADLVASQREMRMEHGEPKDVSGGGLIGHTCPLFGGPTLEERRRGEDGEWEYSCQCPTASEVHAVVKVWPTVFQGSNCHATDASTSHCLGSLNRLDFLLETGEIPPASPRCSPPAYLLEILRELQSTYFRQLYAYDRIRLDSIITGGVAATYAFGGSNATTSRGSSLIVKSDIFGYPIYVVPLRHFQASGNTLSHDVHGEFVAERALLLSALDGAPAFTSTADLASPANLAAPASTASASSADLASSSSASQHPSLRTAPVASVKLIPIVPEPSLERAAELHDLLNGASGRAERSIRFEDALVVAGVDSNASGLAALQMIANDLRRRDLHLPTYAGGTSSNRSSTSYRRDAAKPSPKRRGPIPGRWAPFAAETIEKPFKVNETLVSALPEGTLAQQDAEWSCPDVDEGEARRIYDSLKTRMETEQQGHHYALRDFASFRADILPRLPNWARRADGSLPTCRSPLDDDLADGGDEERLWRYVYLLFWELSLEAALRLVDLLDEMVAQRRTSYAFTASVAVKSLREKVRVAQEKGEKRVSAVMPYGGWGAGDYSDKNLHPRPLDHFYPSDSLNSRMIECATVVQDEFGVDDVKIFLTFAGTMHGFDVSEAHAKDLETYISVAADATPLHTGTNVDSAGAPPARILRTYASRLAPDVVLEYDNLPNPHSLRCRVLDGKLRGEWTTPSELLKVSAAKEDARRKKRVDPAQADKAKQSRSSEKKARARERDVFPELFKTAFSMLPSPVEAAPARPRKKKRTITMATDLDVQDEGGLRRSKRLRKGPARDGAAEEAGHADEDEALEDEADPEGNETAARRGPKTSQKAGRSTAASSHSPVPSSPILPVKEYSDSLLAPCDVGVQKLNKGKFLQQNVRKVVDLVIKHKGDEDAVAKELGPTFRAYDIAFFCHPSPNFRPHDVRKVVFYGRDVIGVDVPVHLSLGALIRLVARHRPGDQARSAFWLDVGKEGGVQVSRGNLEALGHQSGPPLTWTGLAAYAYAHRQGWITQLDIDEATDSAMASLTNPSLADRATFIAQGWPLQAKTVWYDQGKPCCIAPGNAGLEFWRVDARGDILEDEDPGMDCHNASRRLSRKFRFRA
ncbi:hypothetical protein JCM10049v2_004008 [Rhodotorula toruloides]